MKQVFGGITGDSSDITAGDSIIGITNYLCYSGTVVLVSRGRHADGLLFSIDVESSTGGTESV